MSPYILSVAMAVLGLAAGWLRCVEHGEGKHRVRPIGWIVLGAVIVAGVWQAVAMERQEARARLTTPISAESGWDDEIISVLKSARQRIDIGVDFICYAAFSKPSFFDQYVKVILSKNQERIQIHIYHFDEPTRLAMLKEQFYHRWYRFEQEEFRTNLHRWINPEKLWESSQSFKNKLGALSQRLKVPDIRTFRGLIDALMKDERLTLARLKKATNLLPRSGPKRRILGWVADQKRAVFMGVDGKHQFKTMDASLAELLSELFQSYRGSS